MTAAPALEAMLAELCGEPGRRLRPLGGGDVGTSYCAELASGRCTFAKTLPRGPTGALACEAEGLAWLREAAALRIPEVLGFGDSDRGPALALPARLPPVRLPPASSPEHLRRSSTQLQE